MLIFNVPNIFYAFFTMHVAPAADFYLPFSRMWELGIGGLVAYFYQVAIHSDGRCRNWLYTPSYSYWRSTTSVTGLALILVALGCINARLPYPGILAILPTAGTALLIISGEQAWINRLFLRQRVLVFIGLISYPLYLWHWPLLVFTRSYYSILPHHAMATILLASLLLAYVTYTLVEKPIRYAKEPSARIRSARILIGLMLILIMGSAIGWINHGFPYRVPPILRINKLAFDHEAMRKLWRMDRCFFLDPNHAFAPDCIDAPRAGPLVVLWGDSHAAALYPGLHALQATNNFRLAQFTVASCPPILGMIDNARLGAEKNQCATRNQETLRTLIRLKPDNLIVSADWSSYNTQPKNQENFENLEQTLHQLKQSGIKKITVIGPVPLWPSGPQLPLSQAFIKTPQITLPFRTFDGLQSVESSEMRVKQITLNVGVNYISPSGILCISEGCLIRLGDTPDDLLFWDLGHFTEKGSIYFVKELSNSGALP